MLKPVRLEGYWAWRRRSCHARRWRSSADRHGSQREGVEFFARAFPARTKTDSKRRWLLLNRIFFLRMCWRHVRSGCVPTRAEGDHRFYRFGQRMPNCCCQQCRGFIELCSSKLISRGGRVRGKLVPDAYKHKDQHRTHIYNIKHK